MTLIAKVEGGYAAYSVRDRAELGGTSREQTFELTLCVERP